MMKRNVFLIAAVTLLLKANVHASVIAERGGKDTVQISTVKSRKSKIVGGTQMNPAHDLVDNLSLSTEHTIFATAIAKSGLTETLKSKGPVTLFAPTNEAFAKLPAGALDTLYKKAHNIELTNFVSYYIIPGKLTSKDIAKKINSNHGEASFTTLAGAKLRAKINENRNIVLIDENGNESVISQFDIELSNGVIDVLNGVLTTKSR